jgi:CheY-like chemotaxis protein
MSNYKPVSILLVEDDDVDAMAVHRAFNKLKLANKVYRAKDGVNALEMLKNGDVPKPFIILLDLNLPKMSGLEMLKELRKDPHHSDSIVFVLTTSNLDEDRNNAYNEHVAGYIVKTNLALDFSDMIEMFDHYWRLIEFPVPGSKSTKNIKINNNKSEAN